MVKIQVQQRDIYKGRLPHIWMGTLYVTIIKTALYYGSKRYSFDGQFFYKKKQGA